MSIKTLTEQISCTWLCDVAAKVPRDQAIVEVGVFQGGSLAYLAKGALAGDDPPVFGVDAWGLGDTYRTRPHLRRQYGPHNQAFAAEAAPTATLIRGLSTIVAGYWRGPKIGLLFIDADHSYASVMADYWVWQPHLASDALVAFDDYWTGRFPGVIQAVNELMAVGDLTDFQLIGKRLATARYAG